MRVITELCDNLALHWQAMYGRPSQGLHYSLAKLAGDNVMIEREDEMLTLQEAADRLNVSHPHMVRLLDQEALPHTGTGACRRLRVQDVAAYKVERDMQREGALGRLVTFSEEMGGYRLGRSP